MTNAFPKRSSTGSASLDAGQWEAVCDGCGKWCLHKLEDEDTGRIYPTNVACRLLDLSTARCGDYKHRRRHVPDCLTLTKAKVDDLEWLPQTCAYRLRAESQPLPDWHYLVCRDRSEEHTSELMSLMRISYAVFSLKKQP